MYIHGKKPALLKAEIRRETPNKPGVYGMFNEQGQLIYLGKRKNLRRRLLSYSPPRIEIKKRARSWPNPEPLAGKFALMNSLLCIENWN